MQFLICLQLQIQFAYLHFYELIVFDYQIVN